MSIQVENIHFPATAGDLFLAGAGVRGLKINGTFIKFTAIGVYLPTSSLASLAPTWKGKTGSDLAGSPEFFKDVIKGEFEKFTKVTMILPLKGEEYAGKVTENCVAIWKEKGVFTDSEAEAVEKFKELFKEKCFGPGQSILFTQYPDGKLKIAFSKYDSIPEKEEGIIANKALSEAVLESIIGEKGVSPEAKHSLAERISKMLDEFKEAGEINGDSSSEKK